MDEKQEEPGKMGISLGCSVFCGGRAGSSFHSALQQTEGTAQGRCQVRSGLQRSSHVRCWMSDDMKSSCSFAGGKNDPSDRDVVATALREAKEELGITVTTECVWGTLKPIKDSVSLVTLHML